MPRFFIHYFPLLYIDSLLLLDRKSIFSTPVVILTRAETELLGDPEVTANIYFKSRNLPNTDAQNYSTDLR